MIRHTPKITKKGTASCSPATKKKRFIVADIYGDYIQAGIVDTIDGVVYPLTTQRIIQYMEFSKTDRYFCQLLEVYENWQKEEMERMEA